MLSGNIVLFQYVVCAVDEERRAIGYRCKEEVKIMNRWNGTANTMKQRETRQNKKPFFTKQGAFVLGGLQTNTQATSARS